MSPPFKLASVEQQGARRVALVVEDRWVDLAAAVRIFCDEFKYQGIYLIEQGVPAGPDPYANIQEIRDFMLEHI